MQMVNAHNVIGVDYASLGNHEFDFSINAFLNVSKTSKFPWLNANCYEAKTGKLLRGAVPNAIKTFKSKKFGYIPIGIFGVMYDMKDPSKGLYWSDPLEAAKQQVKLLQAQKVDMVIAMTHQDLEDDNQFSKEVKGVNLIYGGHDHNSMLQTNFGTPYLKADMDFRSIWASRLEFYAASGDLAATTVMTHRAIPIREAMPTDPTLETVIANYAKMIGVLTARVIGSLCEPLDLTKNVVRAKDASIGAIFSDACLSFYGKGSADVAVTNGGRIRTDMVYPAGPITMGQVIAWSPFGNTLIVIETDGASLKKYIQREMLASCGDKSTLSNGFYVHPAGFKYSFVCSGKVAGNVTDVEWFKHSTRSGPLLDTDEFKLALSNYLYTTEFLATPGAVVKKVIVSEAEASRIDAALEIYAKSFPNSNVCVKADGCSKVVAAYA